MTVDRIAAVIALVLAAIVFVSYQPCSATEPRGPPGATGGRSEREVVPPLKGGECPVTHDMAQLTDTIYHYATSPTTPQQTRQEVGVSYEILQRRRPCNFLIFGLGYDSQMWHSFNLGGRTQFLEENKEWVDIVVSNNTFLNATVVKYSKTNMTEQSSLLESYMDEPSCRPGNAVKGNEKCKLALSMLSDDILNTEWDMIMIDAPRGFKQFPGRHAAIWTAATLARMRKGDGHTDVFVHDVNRPAEKNWGLELLCLKYRKHEVRKLWHFEIPKASDPSMSADKFC
ncbi:putative methyltransferase At1g27930 [Diplonema papillatum]|nr:putative methyltransferase At1g27930 [Diplonema papillatum]|eukprot:gene15482-23651_t